MPGVSTFYTFYDDVRVPASSIVAGENEGWRLITTQLNFERAALGNMGALEPLFEKTLHWARTTELDGGRLVDQPWVRQALARVEAQVGAYKIMNLRVNAAMTKGALGMGEASAVKVFGTELTQQVARELLEVLDRAGTRKGAATTTNGEPHADVFLDGAAVSGEDRLPGNGTEMIESLYARALVGLCAIQLGVTERALRMAAAYTTEPEQFGRPSGSFQAVQQRMADAFIDVEAIRWTMWQAAWLLGQGRPAAREASIAKFWAGEAGARVATTAQQVHGGIGIDTTYPLFRYFLWAKHNELTLGSASAQLARLGAVY
jgi:alkylation response protein AidB-like acyl-CoA dehydrogenase